MTRLLLLLILISIGRASFAQYVYTIKADSVKITNSCDTAELIIENHTQTVLGFLFNKGRGRTEFRRAAIKLNDSAYLIGADTINVMSPDQVWLTKGNSGINEGVNFLGTKDTAGLVIKTNNLERARFSGTSGNMLVGNGIDNGARLQVNGLTSSLGLVSTSNSPGIQKMDGTWTATGDNQNNVSFEGNFTSRNNNNDRLYGYVFQPTLNASSGNAGGQLLAGVKISPNLNGTAAKFALEVVGDILMSGSPDNMIRLGGGYLGTNDNGSAVFLRNKEGYGITVAANSVDLNAHGNILLGSTASATNQFILGRQEVFSSEARTFVLFRGPNPSSDITFSPTSGEAKFIEIGSNSTAGNGRATFQPNTGSATYTSLSVNDYVNQTGVASGSVSMLDLNMGGNINGPLYGVRVLNPNAQSGFAISAPTAKVHIGAGSATAGSAPLKLTAGAVLSTPENGAIEFDGTNLYLTENTSRYKLAKTLGGQLTTDFGGVSLNGFGSVTATLTVAGAQPGDVVNVSANSGAANSVSLIVTAYITSANTVTLRAYNANPIAVTIASDTYKVRVIR